MRAAIVGSRRFTKMPALHAALAACPWGHRIREVVSGGAEGADTLAEDHARAQKMPRFILPVTPEEWRTVGKKAGPMRNTRIVTFPEVRGLLALWDGVSPGTLDAMKQAKKAGLLLFCYIPPDLVTDAAEKALADLGLTRKPPPGTPAEKPSVSNPRPHTSNAPAYPSGGVEDLSTVRRSPGSPPLTDDDLDDLAADLSVPDPGDSASVEAPTPPAQASAPAAALTPQPPPEPAQMPPAGEAPTPTSAAPAPQPSPEPVPPETPRPERAAFALTPPEEDDAYGDDDDRYEPDSDDDDDSDDEPEDFYGETL